MLVLVGAKEDKQGRRVGSAGDCSSRTFRGRNGVTNHNSYICSLPSRGHTPMRNPANTPVAFGNSPEGYSGRRVGLEPSPRCPRSSSGALLEVTVHTDPTGFPSCEVGAVHLPGGGRGETPED